MAILGVALNALWPLLAHAASAAPQEFAAPICTTNKAYFTAPANGGELPAKTPPASSALPHCPFCLGVSDNVPALAATPAVAWAAALPRHAPVLVQAVAWTSFTHPYSHPRGPPVLS